MLILDLAKCDGHVKLECTNNGFFELISSIDKCVSFLDMNDMYNNKIKMNLNDYVKNYDEKFFNWNYNPTPAPVYFSGVLGYPYYSDLGATLTFTNEYGQWGIENNEWYSVLDSETICPFDISAISK
jgi:hypothetical protein